MSLQKTKLLFRASGVGALAVQKQGAGITPTQLETIAKHEQQIIDGKKPLTPIQATELQRLKDKRDAPPELSDTAKAFVRQLWLWREKGIRYEVSSKYLEKGLWSEQEALKLLRKVLGRYVEQYTGPRLDNGVFVGILDAIEEKIKTGHDNKCSWNAETFMNAELTINNEWQARIYMELYGLDVFHVNYCLVDAPEHIFNDELFRWKRKFNIIDHDVPEHKEKFEIFRRGLIYSDNPLWTDAERVKTFTIYRDDEHEQKMLFMYDQVKSAVDYYHTIVA